MQKLIVDGARPTRPSPEGIELTPFLSVEVRGIPGESRGAIMDELKAWPTESVSIDEWLLDTEGEEWVIGTAYVVNVGQGEHLACLENVLKANGYVWADEV